MVWMGIARIRRRSSGFASFRASSPARSAARSAAEAKTRDQIRGDLYEAGLWFRGLAVPPGVAVVGFAAGDRVPVRYRATEIGLIG